MIASTNFSPSVQAAKKARISAMITIAGVLYFALTIIALHVLRPDLNPISHFTSEYAVGPYSFLMTSAFLSMSLASFALVIGLYQTVLPPARSLFGLGLLGIWAIGVLIAMIFPVDPDGAPQTLSGTIHQTAGPLTFLCLSVGALLVSWRLNHDAKWSSLYRPELILSFIMLVAFIATAFSFATGSGFGGVAQRIVLGGLVAWMLLIASKLITNEFHLRQS